MTDHFYLCQTDDVAERLAELGYSAQVWDVAADPAAYAGRSVTLVGKHQNLHAALDIALVSTLALEAGAREVRVLEYPDAPYVTEQFDLSRKKMPHDLLVHRILDDAAEQDTLRPPPPDILLLDIAHQFAGEPPPQR